MEYIKDWALTLCLCSIGSALIYFLAPKGSMEKPLRTVISIFLLAAVISPLMSIKDMDFKDFGIDFDSAEGEIEENAENINNSVISSFESLVAQSVTELLKNAGYEGFTVSVHAAADDNKYIRAESIEITFKSLIGINETAVKNIVNNDTGIIPVLNAGGEVRG